MIKQLLTYFPPAGTYDTFIDAYGGSGVVLLNKPECPIEIYNDLDNYVATLFHVLVDPALFADFQRLCERAYYSETLSNEYIERLRDSELVQTGGAAHPAAESLLLLVHQPDAPQRDWRLLD